MDRSKLLESQESEEEFLLSKEKFLLSDLIKDELGLDTKYVAKFIKSKDQTTTNLILYRLSEGMQDQWGYVIDGFQIPPTLDELKRVEDNPSLKQDVDFDSKQGSFKKKGGEEVFLIQIVVDPLIPDEDLIQLTFGTTNVNIRDGAFNKLMTLSPNLKKSGSLMAAQPAQPAQPEQQAQPSAKPGRRKQPWVRSIFSEPRAPTAELSTAELSTPSTPSTPERTSGIGGRSKSRKAKKRKSRKNKKSRSRTRKNRSFKKNNKNKNTKKRR